MQNDARYTLIGTFFLVVIIAGTLFLFWAARWTSDDANKLMDVVFQGTVSGLNEGAAVTFNGIRVGDVKDLSIDPENPAFVLARLSVEMETPVKIDTVVTLEYQGLTGIATVALEGGGAASSLAHTAENPIPRLTAKRSAVQDLLKSAGDIMSSIETTANRLDDLMAANEQSISTTLANIEVFSIALAQNSDKLKSLSTDTSTAAREIAKLSENLNGLIVENRENLTQILTDTRAVTGEMASEKAAIGSILSNANTATQNLSGAALAVRTLVETNSAKLTSTIEDASKVSALFARSEDSIERSLANLETVSATLAAKNDQIATTIDNIDKVSASVASKDAQIAAFIEDASKVASQMVSLTQKAESVLGSVDTAFKGDSANFFENAAAAAESVRRLSEKLEAQTGAIASDISKFTGTGLRDLEALIAETRITMRKLDSTLTIVEDNPQRFIFGGDEVKTYAPR